MGMYPLLLKGTFDPFWERFAERDVPLVIHVGTEGAWRKPVPSSFGNNGQASPTHQSDAPRDAHSFLGIGFAPGLFLGALVLDGVFQRIPGLRVCVAELGAVWVPSWLRQLDHAARAFRHAQPEGAVEVVGGRVARHLHEATFARYCP